MKWLTFKVQKSPGFRFNLTDLGLIVLLVATAASLYLYLPQYSFFAIPLYVGMTFFLFCNVFRIGNKLEPLWYIPFFVLAAWGVYTLNMQMFWILVGCVIEPLKWVLIVYRMKKGPYWGICYEKFDRLPDGLKRSEIEQTTDQASEQAPSSQEPSGDKQS
jgi:hypothetical protein